LPGPPTLGSLRPLLRDGLVVGGRLCLVFGQALVVVIIIRGGARGRVKLDAFVVRVALGFVPSVVRGRIFVALHGGFAWLVSRRPRRPGSFIAPRITAI
jgi:hypothetical protein